MTNAHLIEDHAKRTRNVLYFVTFLVCLGIGSFAYTIPLISLDQRMDFTWLGSAFAGFYLARLIAAPIFGLVADTFGTRRTLISAMIIGCLVPFVYFLIPTITTLYFVQFCIGITAGAIRPVGMAALGDASSQSVLPRQFATYASIFSAAAVAGPILGSLLYADKSVPHVLITLSTCMGLAVATAFLFLPDSAARPSKAANEPKTKLSRHTIMGLLIAICGRTMGLGFLAAFYPIILSTIIGKNGLQIGFIFAIPGAATFLGLLITSRFSHQKPHLIQVLTGLLISACSLYLLADCTQAWQFAILGMTMGLGAAWSIPPSMALASSATDKKGTVFGVANMAAGVGFLAGPLLGGMIIQNYHSPLPAMQVLGLLGAASTIPICAIILRDRLHWGIRTAYVLTGSLAAILLLTAGVRMSHDTNSPTDTLHRFTDVAMGTIVNLTLEADSREQASMAAKRTITAMRSIQQDFDFRNPEGSIGRINAHAGTSWVQPSLRTYTLLKRSVDISHKSNGVFDPTIGALTSMPVYYAIDPTIAREKTDLVNFRQVLFDHEGKRVRLEQKGMVLDLGGIAKGTIVDMAVNLLREQGIRAGIVEAGGDFYCFGDRDWTVGIRHPRNASVYQTITVREKGVCGSGDYQQFITTETTTTPSIRHHIINPSTMEPATESIGVSVIADTTETADALATTLFIMGPAKGTAFLDSHYPDSASIWFLPNDTVTTSSNFPR